jgi:hypothetical protein
VFCPMSSFVDGSQVQCPKKWALNREGARIPWAKLTDPTGFNGNYWPGVDGFRLAPLPGKAPHSGRIAASEEKSPSSWVRRVVPGFAETPVLARKLQHMAAEVLAGGGRETVFFTETF